MARVEAAIYSILSGSTPLTDLVSTRIYPLSLPQEAIYPAIVYERTGTLRHTSFQTDPNLSETRFQITILADTVSEMHNVADKVKQALWRYKNTIAGIQIEDVWPENESSIYDSGVDAHLEVIDYTVLHIESTS